MVPEYSDQEVFGDLQNASNLPRAVAKSRNVRVGFSQHLQEVFPHRSFSILRRKLPIRHLDQHFNSSW
jgi:hypothetical protein